MANIQGDCDARSERVERSAFADNFTRGEEVGASVAVTLDGRPVVDLWGGHADQAGTQLWERDTLVNIYSSTKGLAAMCAHRLVDEGRLELDAPVARLLARVRRQGKAELPVRYLLMPSGRHGRNSRADAARGALRLGRGHSGARAPGALVEAGRVARLPRHYLRLGELVRSISGAVRRRTSMQELIDKMAIKEVIARFSIAVDRGKVDDFVSIWTEDAVFEVGSVKFAIGHKELGELCAAIDRLLPGVHHTTSNHVIEIDGDKAHSTCEVMAFITRPDQIHVAGQGFYEDDLVKVDGQWLLAYRKADAVNPEVAAHGPIGTILKPYSDWIADFVMKRGA